MSKAEISVEIARANLGRSVIRLNPGYLQEICEKNDGFLTFGIKNTAALPNELIDKLRRHPDFLWLTVDKMADLGRSIDTDLVNPLTYRLMTGSTSGGCVNILKGINSLCIGTDGGGSVLAPALSTNLFSFMGKGCGLALGVDSRSTDGLAFLPGAGVVASTFDILLKASNVLCDRLFGGPPEKKPRIVVPERGCLILPDGSDARDKMQTALDSFSEDFEVHEFQFSSPFDRTATTRELSEIFENNTDIVLTWEGPIDVFGYDETIPRAFGGSAVQEITGSHGKALIKSANICGCSALTVPGAELAAGFVIVCGQGFEKASMGFYLAQKLSMLQKRPDMFEYYYINREKHSPECMYE